MKRSHEFSFSDNESSSDEFVVPSFDEETEVPAAKKFKPALEETLESEITLPKIDVDTLEKSADEKQERVQQNLSKFRTVAVFAKENVTIHPGVKQVKPQLGLAQKYWLEKLDPEHRAPNYLAQWYSVWQMHNKSENFFDFLNQHEKNYPQSMLNKARGPVIYNQDPLLFKTQYKDGKIYDKYDVEIDTLSYQDAQYPAFAGYIIDKNGRLLLTEYKDGTLHHSSFTGGDKVLCSGMIKIANGKIIEINNRSGHYFHPEKYNIEYFQQGIKAIPESVFSENAIVNFGGNIQTPNGVMRLVEDLKYTREIFLDVAQKQIDRTKNNSYFFMRDPRENHIAQDSLNLLKDIKRAYSVIKKDQNSVELSDLKIKIANALDKLKKVHAPSLQLKNIISWSEEAQQEIFNDLVQTKSLRK